MGPFILVRLSGRYLNHLNLALKHRTALLNTDITGKIEKIKTENEDHPYGPDVKMVRQHKLQSRLLTPEEKDEAVKKYQEGLTMTAVADLYGCHRVTVGRILRARGIDTTQNQTKQPDKCILFKIPEHNPPPRNRGLA